MMVIVWGYLSQQISQQIGKRLGGLILIFYSENQKKIKKNGFCLHPVDACLHPVYIAMLAYVSIP